MSLAVPRTKPRWAIENFIVVPIAILFVIGLVVNALRPPAPIHELVDTYADPSVVIADDTGVIHIRIMTKSMRRATCPTRIYRTLANERNGKVIYQTMSEGGTVPPDAKLVEIPFELTSSLVEFPPGTYLYSAYAINDCGDGDVHLVPSKTARFRIESPSRR